MSQAPKAFVLAAGFGTRLRPWSDEKAKPLIPVAGVEALFFAIYRLAHAGITEIIVNAHYKAEQIRSALDHFAEFFPKISFKYSFEKEILGTGGGIIKVLAENEFPNGLLVLNGDTLGSFDLAPLFNVQGSTLAVSYDKNFLEIYNPLWIDQKNKWTSQNSGKAAHFLGAHFLCPSDISLLQSKKLRVKEVDLFEGIYTPLETEKRSVEAVEFLKDGKDFWFDLNTKELHKKAGKELAGSFFNVWKNVLGLRHPKLEPELALKFWPLSSMEN